MRRTLLNGAASLVAVIILGFGLPADIHGQTAKPNDKALADEIRQLKDQVSRLQQSMKQAPPARGMGMQGAMPGTQAGQSGMPAQGPMGMMSMEDEHSSRGSSQNVSVMSGMSGMGMSGMDMMGRMAGAPQMAGQASLPGFPGLSHLYHVGATGFFLDHPEHITLTGDQQRKLGQIKEKALLEKASTQRKIEEAEQQLFTLTAADQPALGDIQAKAREIGELQGQQRIAYIQAVGEAARVLTDEQRRTLVGQEGAPSTSHSEHH